MIQFDPQFGPAAFVFWLIAAAALTAWNYRGAGRFMRKPYFRSLIGLRVLSIILITLILLRPHTEFKSPDPDNFSVKILADCSGSMSAADCVEGRRRFDVLKGFMSRLEGDDPLFRRDRIRNMDVFGFSEAPRRLFNQPPSILPGDTAIGMVLNEVLESSAHAVVGAVILLSDGNSNTGLAVTEAAKRLAARNVPVSCVGIGEPGGEGDVAVHAPERPLKVKKGEALDVPIAVSNTFPAEVDVGVAMLDGDLVVERRKLTIAAGSTETVAFTTRPVRAGDHVYQVQLDSIPADRDPATDVDYVSVEVGEPDVFSLLVLSDALDWNYKFLKINVARDEQLRLAAVVKLADERYYHLGLDGEESVLEEGYPEEAEAFEPIDALIATAGAAATFSKATRERIGEFVANRGGGLLFFGSPSEAVDDVRRLLPVKETELKRPLSKRYLEVFAPFIFPPDRTETLRTPPGPYLPAGTPFLALRELKIGARSALDIRDDDAPVMAVQRYGGGRVVHMGSRATWRWRMADAVDQNRYKTFWSHLLVWLGSAGKPRVKAMFNGAKIAVNQSSPLNVKILDASYLPAAEARASVVVTAPDGTRTESLLALDARAPGVHGEIFTPEKSGEHKVAIKVEFPDGETLTRAAHFVATRSGVEHRDDAYREDVLRDVARITGGRFIHYADVGETLDAPLSNAVPTRREKLFWMHTWPTLLLLLATLAAEWFLRRRVGLK